MRISITQQDKINVLECLTVFSFSKLFEIEFVPSLKLVSCHHSPACHTYPPTLLTEKDGFNYALVSPRIVSRLDIIDLGLLLAHRRCGQACSRGGAVRQLELCWCSSICCGCSVRQNVTTRCVVRITSHILLPRDIRRCGKLKVMQSPFLPYIIHHLTFYFRGPGSSVDIATYYELDASGSNPGGDEIFRPSRPAMGPTQPPVK